MILYAPGMRHLGMALVAIGALLAAIVLVLLNNAMNLLDIDTNLQAMAKGLVFVTALIVFTRGRRFAEAE